MLSVSAFIVAGLFAQHAALLFQGKPVVILALPIALA